MRPLIAVLVLHSVGFGQSASLFMASGGSGATVATPTDSPGTGTYSSSQNVTLSNTTGGTTICYRTDGAAPTATTAGVCDAPATTYSGAFNISATATLKAIGTKVGLSNSGVLTSGYIITGVPGISLISKGCGPTTPNTNGGTFTIDTTGATLVAMAVTSSNATSLSVSSSLNPIWTKLTTQVGAGNVSATSLYYVQNPVVGADMISVTGPNEYPGFCVASFSLMATTSVHNAGTDNGAAAASTNTVQPGTVTIPAGAQLAITGFGWYGLVGLNETIDSGFTIAGQISYAGSISFGTGLAYKIQAAGTGGAVNPRWTLGGVGTEMNTTIATFKGQ